MRSHSLALGAAALLLGSASAFTALPGATSGPRTVALGAHQSGDASPLDRAAFLKTSFASIAALALSPLVSYAADEVGDLSMPSADEQKASEVS